MPLNTEDQFVSVRQFVQMNLRERSTNCMASGSCPTPQFSRKAYLNRLADTASFHWDEANRDVLVHLEVEASRNLLHGCTTADIVLVCTLSSSTVQCWVANLRTILRCQFAAQLLSELDCTKELVTVSVILGVVGRISTLLT